MNRYREKPNLDWLQRQPNHKEKKKIYMKQTLRDGGLSIC